MRSWSVLVLAVAGCTCGAPKPKAPPAADDGEEAQLKGDAGVKPRGPQGPVMGGEVSLEALGKKLVEALNEENPEAMYALVLQRGEFMRLFPVLAANPAVRKLGPDFVWANQDADVREAIADVLRTYGGKDYTFVRLGGAAKKDRGRLVQHDDAKLRVRNSEGAEVELAFLGPIFEHRDDKTFRISVYK